LLLYSVGSYIKVVKDDQWAWMLKNAVVIYFNVLHQHSPR